MGFYIEYGILKCAWVRARLHDRNEGVAQMRQGFDSVRQQGYTLLAPFYSALLAELDAENGEIDCAVETIDRALAETERTGQRTFEAEAHRIRGEILLKRDPANTAPAEEAFLAAIAVAQAQKARSFGLRAALSLAKLYQSTDRPAEARAVLAPALEGFSPTPEMPEIAEAQALLETLAQTEAVKAEAAQRRRRSQLQVAYGNALIAARGYGAPETTEAFESARQQASDGEAAPERLSADYGLWAASYVRGDLASMRVRAAAFLREVEATPDSPEAGVAHRLLGTTHWWAGEMVEARGHLERALALFEPGRDDDLALRFGQDPGVVAMVQLANALWRLGEVERAVSLARDADARIAALAHAPSRVYGRMMAAQFALLRGDLGQIEPNGSELARLARDYDLKFWRPFGVFFEGWVKVERGALPEGLADMRRGAELVHEQNVLALDGVLGLALGEAEARSGDPERALVTVDEALASTAGTRGRAWDAELHGLRGEILLQRDPSHSSPAEQAFQTAIAVARRQGARSLALRAALSLAKLYQSTGRAVEAHAVLAPALEGFAPTPEMPEIAVAQALLAGLV